MQENKELTEKLNSLSLSQHINTGEDTRRDLEKEYASLWLAVEELNRLDAEKELALQELLNDREEALVQRDMALLKVDQLTNEYNNLYRDIEVLFFKMINF